MSSGRRQTSHRVRSQTTVAATGRESFRESYLRPTLLGAIDGLITSFVIIAGGVAGDVQKSSVLVIAFSSLVADALSMGVSESISSRSQSAMSWRVAFLKGGVCFLSFVFFGVIPILAYSLPITDAISQVLSAVAFALMLAVTGCVRAFVANEGYLQTAFEVVGLGVVTGAVAYAIAKFIPH